MVYKKEISTPAVEVFPHLMTLWSPAPLIPPPKPTDIPGRPPLQTPIMYSVYLPDIKRPKVGSVNNTKITSHFSYDRLIYEYLNAPMHHNPLYIAALMTKKLYGGSGQIKLTFIFICSGKTPFVCQWNSKPAANCSQGRFPCRTYLLPAFHSFQINQSDLKFPNSESLECT